MQTLESELDSRNFYQNHQILLLFRQGNSHLSLLIEGFFSFLEKLISSSLPGFSELVCLIKLFYEFTCYVQHSLRLTLGRICVEGVRVNTLERCFDFHLLEMEVRGFTLYTEETLKQPLLTSITSTHQFNPEPHPERAGENVFAGFWPLSTTS